MTLEDLPFFVEVMSSTISTGLQSCIILAVLQPLHEIYDLKHDNTLDWTKKERGTLLQCLKTVCIPFSGLTTFIPQFMLIVLVQIIIDILIFHVGFKTLIAFRFIAAFLLLSRDCIECAG